MSDVLSRKGDGTTWYPVPIKSWDLFMFKKMYQGCGCKNAYAMRKNICYNMQCLEYLNQTMIDLQLTSVLLTQTFKLFILVSGGIVETLLYFILKTNNLYKQREWEEETAYKSSKMKCNDNIWRKSETRIFVKLGKTKDDEMNFISKIEIAKSRKVLGSDSNIYKHLDDLRKKRNKVHLHLTNHETDTDWNNFWMEDVEKSKRILFYMFSKIFAPDKEEVKMLYFLRKK